MESNKNAIRCPFLDNVEVAEQLGDSVLGDCISTEKSKPLPFDKSNVSGVMSTFLQAKAIETKQHAY